MKYKLKHKRPMTDKKDLFITKKEVLDMHNQLQKDKHISHFVFGFEKAKK